MSAVPMHQIAIRVTAADGDAPDPAAIERFALDLRAELADLDIARIEQVTAGPAPEGARALEILAAFEFIIHMAEAGEAAAKIIRAVRAVASRLIEHHRQVRVTVANVEIDLASANDDQLRQVATALMAGSTSRSTGVRSALIIANKEFDDPALTQLRAPGHDADALARVLGDAAIGDFSVDLLTDADERTVRRRIAEFFADRSRDDILLLHFSGHGVKDARGRLFLTARDTKLSLLGATGIPASFVNDQLAETQSKRVVLILDCCYSGAFARGASVRADDSVHVADEFGAGNGRIVLTASSATEYAFEGTDLTRSEAQPSAFTSALVNGLETGDADLDIDGEISIDELYEYTYRTVRATTPGQAPMKWSFGVEGSLVIARSVRPAVLPQLVLDDMASDRIVLRLEAVAALARILRTGKPGLAAAAGAALAEVRDEDDSARVRAAATTALGTSAPSPATVATVPVKAATVEPVAVAPVAVEPVAVEAAAVKPETVKAVPAAVKSATVEPAAVKSATPKPVTPKPAEAKQAVIGTASVIEAAAVDERRSERDPASAAVPAQRPSDETAGPTQDTPVTRPAQGAAQPANRIVIAAGILTALSLVLMAIGFLIAHAWPDPLVWLEATAVVLLLATRKQVCGGLLVGALSWEWIYPILIHDRNIDVALATGHRPIVLGNLLAITAMLVGTIGLLRGGIIEPTSVWSRVASLLLLAPVTMIAGAGAGVVITVALEASTDTADGWVHYIGFLSGVAVPLFMFVAPSHVVPRFVLAGWLVTGLAETIDASRRGHNAPGDVRDLVILFIVGAVIALTIMWRATPPPLSTSR